MPAPIRFPTDDELPAELRVDASAYENRWLCDGQVRTWAGESIAIEAAVCVRNGDRVTRPVLGRVPALGEAEAMAALAAAKRAYDLGRGAWPRATMAERLKAVETFLAKLKPLRAEVVKLLMWEIGKTKGDSEKEFDRTGVAFLNTGFGIDFAHLDGPTSAVFALIGIGVIAEVVSFVLPGGRTKQNYED